MSLNESNVADYLPEDITILYVMRQQLPISELLSSDADYQHPDQRDN
jgi:hypothetical protein